MFVLDDALYIFLIIGGVLVVYQIVNGKMVKIREERATSQRSSSLGFGNGRWYASSRRSSRVDARRRSEQESARVSASDLPIANAVPIAVDDATPIVAVVSGTPVQASVVQASVVRGSAVQ